MKTTCLRLFPKTLVRGTARNNTKSSVKKQITASMKPPADASIDAKATKPKSARAIWSDDQTEKLIDCYKDARGTSTAEGGFKASEWNGVLAAFSEYCQSFTLDQIKDKIKRVRMHFECLSHQTNIFIYNS